VPTDADLGRQIRELRKARGLSLAEVAEATQISASFLSLFETGRNDITIGRLVRLIRFFGISITDLIPDPEPKDPVVVRREARRHLSSPVEGIDLFLLTHDTQHTMMPVIGIHDPGGHTEEIVSSENGEQFILVLRGQLEIGFEGSPPIRLRKGDAAYFSTDRVRWYRNAGRGHAEVLGVTTPPTL
jgi:XRE family transcriptional regulator, regulator of sulfur utilization